VEWLIGYQVELDVNISSLNRDVLVPFKLPGRFRWLDDIPIAELLRSEQMRLHRNQAGPTLCNMLLFPTPSLPKTAILTVGTSFLLQRYCRTAAVFSGDTAVIALKEKKGCFRTKVHEDGENTGGRRLYT
jgi:hypothetical protein